MRIWSWNICRRQDAWRMIAQDDSVDVALLQEATKPRAGLDLQVTTSSSGVWRLAGSRHASCAVVAWRPRVKAAVRPLSELGQARVGALQVSRLGSLAAIEVPSKTGFVTLVSAYACWETALSNRTRSWAYADASAHRLISDISALIDSERRHRIIVAGDFNIFKGYGDKGSEYWHQRYQSVFDRFSAVGLMLKGPQMNDGDRSALPPGGGNVATFHTNRESPETAKRQLDFVFASESLGGRVHRPRRRTDSDVLALFAQAQ